MVYVSEELGVCSEIPQLKKYFQLISWEIAHRSWHPTPSLLSDVYEVWVRGKKKVQDPGG